MKQNNPLPVVHAIMNALIEGYEVDSPPHIDPDHSQQTWCVLKCMLKSAEPYTQNPVKVRVTCDLDDGSLAIRIEYMQFPLDEMEIARSILSNVVKHGRGFA